MAGYPQTRNGYWVFDASGFPTFATQAENVIHGFEDQTLDGYSGDTPDFAIQGSNVLRGRYSLEATSGYSAIADDGGDYPTERAETPIEYACRVVPVDGSEPTWLVCNQSESNPYRDCYALTVDAGDNEIRLFTSVRGSVTYIERRNVSISNGREYRPYITLTTNGINGGLRDSTGSDLVRTDSYRDTTHSGGGIGWRHGDGSTAYFDHAVSQSGSMDEISEIVIDDYEDGNLAEYDWPSSSGTRDTTPAAAYAGNYGLEMDGFGSIFTQPGMGLDNYVRDGEPVEFYVNFQNGDPSQYYIYLCPQNTDSNDDTYEVEFIPEDDVMRIQKDKNGSEDTLSGSATGGSSNAYTNDIAYDLDNWYRVEIILDSSEPQIRADLYDASSGEHLVYVEADSESEYITDNNAFGFFCSGSGTLYADHVRENS